MRRIRFLRAGLLIALLPALSLAQEPAPPLPPEPVETPPAPAGPTPPKAQRSRRAPRAATADPVIAQQARPAYALGSLQDAVELETMVAEAANATGLSAEEVRPAASALHAVFVPDPDRLRIGDVAVVRKTATKEGHRVSIIRREPPGDEEKRRIEAAEVRLRKAVEELPAGQRERFLDWAASKRRRLENLADAIAADEGAVARVDRRGDDEARAAVEALLAAERELQAARERLRVESDLLKGRRAASAEESEALADVRRSIEMHNQRLAEQLARVSRERIETSLDRSLVDRYRNLLTDFDRDATRRAIQELLKSDSRVWRSAETRSGTAAGDIERRIEQLRAQRESIDLAIEEATTALVRERAQKLHEEATRRAAAEARERTAQDPGPLPPGPGQRGLPEAGATAPKPRADAYETEIKRLRDELQALRQEVEALRRKNEPK